MQLVSQKNSQIVDELKQQLQDVYFEKESLSAELQKEVNRVYDEWKHKLNEVQSEKECQITDMETERDKIQMEHK